MADRELIISRARQLINEHPDWGKDRINRELRVEFGSGLRRIDLAKLKGSIVQPVMREQATQLLRYQTLRKEGFLPEEAQFYSQWAISQLGMKKVRRFRQSEINQALKHGIPTTKIPDYLKESYTARGFMSKGTIEPDKWNAEVFNELQKPLKNRQSVAIPADRFQFYLNARQRKYSAGDSLRLVSRISPTEWSQRLKEYDTLRRAYFTHWEALKIVTTKTKADKAGKRELQSLDLNNPVWQAVIADRIEFHRQEIKRYMAKGLTRVQAEKLYNTERNNYYKSRKGDTRDDKTPWDALREGYKIKSRKRTDFLENKQLRDAKYKDKKMPYRVAR